MCDIIKAPIKARKVRCMFTEEKSSKIMFISTDCIRANPYQPRQKIDKQALIELCDSIKQYGLMQPIVVRQINNRDYELVAGERRALACRMAGMTEVPAVVVRAGGTDSAVMALVENIQRENLGYIEEAEAFCSLVSEHGITQDELAMRLGKSQSTIANKIRILKLSPQIRALLLEHSLSERHARAILRLGDEKSRLKALGIIIKKGLNVVKSEELIERMLCGEADVDEKVCSIRMLRDVRIFSNTIRQAVDMMKKSGIAAETEKRENEDFIEYTIKIPKNLQDAV